MSDRRYRHPDRRRGGPSAKGDGSSAVGSGGDPGPEPRDASRAPGDLAGAAPRVPAKFHGRRPTSSGASQVSAPDVGPAPRVPVLLGAPRVPAKFHGRRPGEDLPPWFCRSIRCTENFLSSQHRKPVRLEGKNPSFICSMRPLRLFPEGGALVEVTTRTVQGRPLLRPTPELWDIILGVLGRAQKSTRSTSSASPSCPRTTT